MANEVGFGGGGGQRAYYIFTPINIILYLQMYNLQPEYSTKYGKLSNDDFRLAFIKEAQEQYAPDESYCAQYNIQHICM